MLPLVSRRYGGARGSGMAIWKYIQLVSGHGLSAG